jgi:glycosyltransferase involved in cell wall biosynthesis
MKLLYVVARAEYFISHRLDLAHAAKESGFEVAVVTTNFSQTDSEKLKGIRNFFVRFKRGSLNPFTEIKTIFDLFKVFKNFRPNLVHNVGLKPALYCAALARLYGALSVNSINGFGYIFTSKQLKARALKPFVRIALRLALNHSNVAVIVQNSDDFKDCALLLPKCNLHLIAGSGVDVNAFLPRLYKGIFTFTLVARMLWSKGVKEFIEAARLFKSNNPDADVRFLLVGSPDSENPESIPCGVLQNWCREKVVEWYEHTDDIVSVYEGTSVAVLPSYREGMPKSLLEAMACGLPVITTYARGCNDLVQDGVNGLKVPVKDFEALFKAMQKCYLDSENCQSMGKNARQKAENAYSMEVINKQIIDVYKVIGSHSTFNL